MLKLRAELPSRMLIKPSKRKEKKIKVGKISGLNQMQQMAHKTKRARARISSLIRRKQSVQSLPHM